MADPANQIFLPWVQPGAAAAIPDAATERLAPDQAAAVALRIVLTVNGEPVEQRARLYGPGDVIGIDPQQVVRREPQPGTTDFEPNYFPAIEFDRPDFPWLFTPARADAEGRLRPWLCLVVVRRQAGVTLGRGGGPGAPTLTIAAPAVPDRELPDLAEAHLWAHAQVTGAARGELRQALAGDPARTVARLLCPRRLDPATEYLACVVPTFEVGRKAGLGLPLGADERLAPAWAAGAASVTLPVYHAWEFRTGLGGDFEELVARLQPRALPAGVGKRPLVVGRPGFAIAPPPDPEATLGLEGALRPLDSAPDPWPEQARAPFQAALAKILNTPWELATQAGAGGDPVVGPPVYGGWHAGAHLVGPAAPPAPPWLDELNLDPRHRAVAALGTRVAQAQQEELMAAAWEQLGVIERVNQRLRQAQLSRAVNEQYHARSFQRFREERLLQIVAPARARVMLEESAAGAQPGAPRTAVPLALKLATSFVPPTAVAAPLRRLASPRGAISRTYLKAGAPGVRAAFTRFNAPLGAAPARTRGAVTLDQISSAILDPSQPGFLWNPLPVGHWERVSVALLRMIEVFRLASMSVAALPQLLLPTTPAPLRAAAQAHHSTLTSLFSAPVARDMRQVMVLAELRSSILAGLAPARAVSRAALATFSSSSPAPRSGDELEPIMDAPSFPQPMYAALREVAPDLIFPGLELVPPNTVQLLQTNAKFVEAFLVGLNAELGRELLWRDYPTDQRGTSFRQFWDTGAGPPRPDITPIHQWGNRALGTTAVGAGGDKLVLLIRGELLRRYPGTVIYAVRAVRRNGRREPAPAEPATGGPPAEAYPIFRGTLEPDVTFLGFDLTRAEAVAGDGWYFVLQQQPSEPRFGLDDAPFGPGETGAIPPLTSWDDLSWAHLAPSAEALRELSHVGVRAAQLAPSGPARGVWGRNGAHMAFITRQKPARVAIHATELLPQLG